MQGRRAIGSKPGTGVSLRGVQEIAGSAVPDTAYVISSSCKHGEGVEQFTWLGLILLRN